MDIERFFRDRSEAWDRLEAVADKAERPGPIRLSTAEVTELSTLLRGVSFDLATLRRLGCDVSTERRLNDLLIRAHHTFYRRPPSESGLVTRFVTREFPRRVRENRAFVGAAAAVFALPLLLSWAIVDADPSVAHRVLPGSVLYSMEEMYALQSSDPERSKDDAADRGDAAMAGFYVRNNVSIAFQCVALGAFLGLGTLHVLLSNGIQLGTIAGFVTGAGHGEPFIDFVVSHSAPELTAIVIAGAAGLILGHAVLAPGQGSKLDAFATRAKVAAELSAGAAVLLVGAALIEGFWSAEPFPFELKCGVGIALWIALAAYLVLAGRRTAA